MYTYKDLIYYIYAISCRRVSLIQRTLKHQSDTYKSLVCHYLLARQAALFPEKVLKSESVTHIIHLASSSACVLHLRIHALRALAEIVTVGVAPVVSGVDISGLLHMAKEEESMTLKTLTLYVLWVFSTYPREVSFSKHTKMTPTNAAFRELLSPSRQDSLLFPRKNSVASSPPPPRGGLL